MSYKIVRIANVYPEWLDNYYTAFPESIGRSYIDHYNHLIDQAVDVPSSFTKCLKRRGFEAFDIFSNAKPLQNQWKVENACERTGKDLIFEQIKKLQPQVIWLDDMNLIDHKWILYIRENVPSVKIITGHCCAPYNAENLKNLKFLDFLFTCTPCFKTEFEKEGIETYLIYHSFDKSMIDKISNENNYPENDLVFSGSLFTGGGFHNMRIEYLEQFLKVDLPVKIFSHIEPVSKTLMKQAAFYSIQSIQKAGGKNLVKHIPVLKHYEAYGDTPISFHSRKLRASTFPPTFGLDQLKLLAKSRIVFNIHLDQAKSCAGNIRLFEATGVGSCLVTDWKENLPDLFEPEKEVITYKSKDECVDKIRWLLLNPDEVRKISKAGQKRTLANHTTEERVNLINQIFKCKL